MQLTTKKIKSIDEQRSILERSLQEALANNGWLRSNGQIKPSIVFRKKNIKIENIHTRLGQWNQNSKVLVLNLLFDVHFQTEKEEAINHKNTFWVVDAEKRYDIKELSKSLERMMFRIQNQMAFTNKIDKNLYNFWELDKKGWQIIK